MPSDSRLFPIEVASYTRNLMDKEELLKPVSYYAKIRPNYYAAEEAAKAVAKAAKPA